MADHLLIKMKYAAVGHGDKVFLSRSLPPGSVQSMHDIYGASGVGKVLATGDGVPQSYLGKNVTIYRSLHNSNALVGCWSGYAHIHWLDCVIIPDEVAPEAYSETMANVITPYAFRMESLNEGHTGIISTAGTSITGIIMLGISIALKFPLISIVMNQHGKQLLESLSATHVVVQDDPDFDTKFKDLCSQLNTTAVYDALGGTILNRIVNLLPNGSIIYSYGFLGDDEPLTIFMKKNLFNCLTIKPFGNINTQTIRDPKHLARALEAI